MKIGIMQGRLLPNFRSNYQAHPIGVWQKEFYLAKSLKIDSIEFIVDSYFYKDNPILTENGLKEINYLMKETGVNIKSICADIFMDWPIQSIVESELYLYTSLMKKLIQNLSRIGGKDLIIPFVDNSSIKSDKEQEFIIKFLNQFKFLASENGINICLETDLEPKKFDQFIRSFENNTIKINYDSGNSAALGYSFNEELDLYEDKIVNVHIKDRLLNGKSVHLGHGAAELSKVKEFISSQNYSGTITFQAFRDQNPIDTFKSQLAYFNNL